MFASIRRLSVEAGELLVEPPLELGIERGGRPPAPVAGRQPLARPATSPRQRRTSRATTAPAATSPTSGSTQASRLKPRFGGAASTPSPNSVDELVLDLASSCRRPRSGSEMNARMRSAIGELESASGVLQVGQ